MAITPLMNLDLPTPTVTAGPAWATALNAALTVVDSHDHSSGNGARITPSGLNINSALTLNNNNLINSKSIRLTNQLSALSGPDDLAAVYNVNGELFYNDGLGNQVQITASGGLNAASIGGIGGDYASSSALVSYNSSNQTYTFEQSTGVNADLNAASLTIREAASSANGITLNSPTSLSASYSLIMPNALPASNLPISLNNSGQISFGQIETDQIEDEAITIQKRAVRAITVNGSNPGLNGVVRSSSSENYVTDNSGFGSSSVTNLSITITTNGGPVVVGLMPDNSGTGFNPARIRLKRQSGSGNLTIAATMSIRRNDGVNPIVSYTTEFVREVSTTAGATVPPSALTVVDNVPAGTYTYDVTALVQSSDFVTNVEFEVRNLNLYAYEI